LDIGVLLYTEWASTKTSAVAIASCPHREDGKFLATFVNAIPKRSELIPFIPVCIVGGFWEELCFRGVALSLVPHNAWGMMCGVLGSSVVFAAQHLRRGIAASLYSGGYGILFSLLYLASGNVISVMVAHATGNMFVAAYGAHQAAQIRRKAERVPVLF
jgi:membrane protease YdiL (CAAX protease family)